MIILCLSRDFACCDVFSCVYFCVQFDVVFFCCSDASWELCDQFSDLHNPEMYCNLPVCDSSYGRKIRTM